MELIKVNGNEIQVASEFTTRLKQLNEAQLELGVMMDRLKGELLEAMENNGIKSWENDDFRVVYKAPTTRQGVDTKRLKEDGLYELYAKSTPVKSSVVVTFK